MSMQIHLFKSNVNKTYLIKIVGKKEKKSQNNAAIDDIASGCAVKQVCATVLDGCTTVNSNDSVIIKISEK